MNVSIDLSPPLNEHFYNHCCGEFLIRNFSQNKKSTNFSKNIAKLWLEMTHITLSSLVDDGS